jgi:RNA polymerase sigma-70 factor (sigma-E family)
MGNDVTTGQHAEADLGHEWPPELVELFRTERTGYVRLAYLLTGRPAVAEEIVQDAFIATQQAWGGVRNPNRYLRTAVVNRCRSWGRHEQVVSSHPPAPPDPTPADHDELWDALGRLDHRRRAAIVLRYYLDLPHAEIADLLGCRPATVRTTVHRGLAQLRREIER